METEKDWERGRRLLKELLPWARAEAKKGGKVSMRSSLGKSGASHIREDRLDAVMITPAPKGGWHGDIVLKNLPPGIPNTFGTRVESPCHTRAEAEETAKHILVGLLIVAAENREHPANPVFMLNGWSVELPAQVYDEALSIMPEMANGYGTPLQAAARVEQILEELCPEGFDGKAFDLWPREKQARLLSVLVPATLSGLFVWPWRRDAPPPEGS